jgi:hypothetical protein
MSSWIEIKYLGQSDGAGDDSTVERESVNWLKEQYPMLTSDDMMTGSNAARVIHATSLKIKQNNGQAIIDSLSGEVILAHGDVVCVNSDEFQVRLLETLPTRLPNLVQQLNPFSGGGTVLGVVAASAHSHSPISASDPLAFLSSRSPATKRASVSPVNRRAFHLPDYVLPCPNLQQTKVSPPVRSIDIGSPAPALSVPLSPFEALTHTTQRLFEDATQNNFSDGRHAGTARFSDRFKSLLGFNNKEIL